MGTGQCDEETTTQTDVDNGLVNTVIGFAPLKPAEFVSGTDAAPLPMTQDRSRKEQGNRPQGTLEPSIPLSMRSAAEGRPSEGVSRWAGHLGCDRIAATVVEHVDLACKPLRLRGFLFDLRNLVCAHQESSTRVL